jgi:hypothetical protein
LEEGRLCIFSFTSNSSVRDGISSDGHHSKLICRNYGFWVIGFAMLNLTKEKEEDEMIKSF